MFDSVDDSGDRLISLDEYLKAMGQLPDTDHKYGSNCNSLLMREISIEYSFQYYQLWKILDAT